MTVQRDEANSEVLYQVSIRTRLSPSSSDLRLLLISGLMSQISCERDQLNNTGEWIHQHPVSTAGNLRPLTTQTKGQMLSDPGAYS